MLEPSLILPVMGMTQLLLETVNLLGQQIEFKNL